MKNLEETNVNAENNNDIHRKDCGEIKELIDQLEDNKPAESSMEYIEWKKEINKLFQMYNLLCNFRAYKEIN